LASDIGKLRHRIRIEKLTLESDDQGGSIESWTEFKTVWAEIKNKPSYENYVSERIQAPNKFKITIRKLDGIKEDMRIVFKTRIFQIKSIDAIDERLFWMTLDVEENEAGT
jgi:SPP1 family predicted phage head-tail adaptor